LGCEGIGGELVKGQGTVAPLAGSIIFHGEAIERLMQQAEHRHRSQRPFRLLCVALPEDLRKGAVDRLEGFVPAIGEI
jgi:hypothetical protein